MLFPVDSTVISLTSKLFWQEGYHQVKLLNGFSLTENLTSAAVLAFGERHDLSFREEVIDLIPENAVAIMDRGFASWRLIDERCEGNKRFVVHIKNNVRTELNQDRYRVVYFCNLLSKVEFQLGANLRSLTDEEVAELYRQRWRIENLWKMH
ncbi:MAG: transposase [Thermostichus sp. DG02_5_bins_236]